MTWCETPPPVLPQAQSHGQVLVAQQLLPYGDGLQCKCWGLKTQSNEYKGRKVAVNREHTHTCKYTHMHMYTHSVSLKRMQ